MHTPENDPSSAAVGGGGDELEQFSDEFKCCVCLDLIYKPVVLACGHISCFWCVFETMDTWQESRCPVCRHPYYHFPSICWLLHSVLLKLYPKAYQRREIQVKEEEKAHKTFSPQFENYLAASHANQPLESVPSDKSCTTGIPESSSDKITKNVAVEGICSSTGSDHVDRCCKQISITDLLCAVCKELLYRPVVLNCGHVFCEVCIIDSCNESCRCPVCQSMHPNGFPKVCLVLVGFLENHISEEYAARRVAIERLRTGELGSSSTGTTLGARRSSLSMDEYVCSSGHKVHFGVGCDCCGMYPLIGDRYKCKDCLEHIGFDLCEGCYNSSSNLPGRFNQQHKPDHKFEVLGPEYIMVMSHDDAPDDPETQVDITTVDPQTDPEDDVAGPIHANDALDDHEDGEPTP